MNLALVNKQSKFSGCFGERTRFLFLKTSERYPDWIFDNLERFFFALSTLFSEAATGSVL